jgi:hypothetical protein
LTKLSFVRKFRPKRFPKIDPQLKELLEFSRQTRQMFAAENDQNLAGDLEKL